MKESKAVYVTRHKIREEQNLVYNLYANHDREYSDKCNTRSFGCQYDRRKDNVTCTCRNTSPKRSRDTRYFSGVPKQIYAYHGSRSFADIGVGSVKALQKRRVKRVYLPETDDRGVGSSDLSSLIFRKNKLQKSSYYDHKRTSSKCVGGFIENNSVISQKLSPIVQTRSGTTSPKMSIDQRNIEIGSNTIYKNLVTIGTQFEIERNETDEPKQEIVKIDKESEPSKKAVAKVSGHTQKDRYSSEMQGKRRSVIQKKVKEADKVYSSDSLVQHVHNLEDPSDEKQSRASIDPMENKLEREYRKMFSTKDRESKPSVDKPIPEFKSASVLRRRFEALRRGLKKEDGKKNTMPSSQDSVPSRKDASVTSDPPSLEGRSFTDTKKYSPIQAHVEQDKNKSNWPQSDIDSECQGVKGMFNLWGKKFKFEEEAEKVEKPKPRPLPSLAIDINKKPQKESKPKKETDNKKSKRKFFFFKKKSKDQKIDTPKKKETEVYTPKGVTAGRCEIRDGLVMKMRGNTAPKEKISNVSEEGDEIQRRTWFKNFVANSIASARSVNVRWNNSLYATSSSTVFELMDTMYRNNGVVLKSRSEITSEESSHYRSYTKNKVYFDQNIEAWMIPKTITDRPREIPVRIQSHREIKKRNIDVTISDQRWFIERSQAFANKIEVVLHSKGFKKASNNVSSEYLRIDIPKDFFDMSSSDDSKQHPTSDEEVFKIVEYESDLNTKKVLEKGNHVSQIQVIVSVDSKNFEAKLLETVIKRPPTQRDVVIQGSNVNIPKRCDVIGVGIITQRDMRDIRKPILKIQEDLTDDSEEGLQTNHKKCEFAESYLQDYYRHWTPLGIDLFSWCVSDSHLRSCSETSLISFYNQGDGSKSCPNICEDFQTATIISSCNTSSCSQCCEEVPKPDSLPSKLYKKFIVPLKSKTDTDIANKRVLPKDSLEVFKRRKIYAASLKAQWVCSEDKPVSVPSIESKGAQDTMECQKQEKPIISYKPPKPPRPKALGKKHVSVLDRDALNGMLTDQLIKKKPEGILAFKGQTGCDTCKSSGVKCPKHAVIVPKATREIPQPPCKATCESTENPACGKTESSSISSKKSTLKMVLSKLSQLIGSKLGSPLPSKSSPKPGCPGCAGSSPPNSVPCPAETKVPPPCEQPSTPPTHCDTPSAEEAMAPCEKPSPPSVHSKTRRKASPNILCRSCSPPLSPAESKGPSPKTSHDCLSPVQSTSPQKKKHANKTSLLRKDKRCPKCQNKLPCHKFPNCRLSPAQSNENSPCVSPSPHRSPKKSPRISPRGSPKNPETSPCSRCQHKKPNQTFPNCALSPAESKENSPGVSPQRSPKESRRVSPCRSPKKQKTSPCNLTKNTSNYSTNIKTPPKSPCESDQFPWPMDNQVSNQPSPSCSETSQEKIKNKCKPKCPVMQKSSNQSLAPKKLKECKPNCARRKKKQEHGGKQTEHCKKKQVECPENKQQPCPVKQQKPSPARPQKNAVSKESKPKISGLFLKMKPVPKTCSKECLAWEGQDEPGVLRLSSRERITISMKRETPSTEEIREGMNVKVQDHDGNTLFERKDYTCGNSGHKPSVLGDMYKDSNINRVSTPVMVVTNKQKDREPEYKSDVSLTNLIEIQFKLRITQGDKTTEISIANDDEENQDKANEVTKTSPEVFIVENEAKEPEKVIEEGPKNDINIKIVVKNYKPKPNKIYETKTYDDAFSKKISNKFQTVSTGYSDILTDQDDDNVFSIHRATIDLVSSQEKSRTLSKHSHELATEELTEPINLMVSSHSTEHLATDPTEDENIDKSISSKKDTQSYDNYDYTNELDAKDLDTDQDVTLDLNTSNECNDIKYNAKEEKKELLKKVFERAYATPKNKENVRQLRDSLKIILTDSSDNEMNAASNELAKDVTYTSLKPDYFRNTDSMNNYYKIESSLTIEESKVASNIQYPTGENNSCTSGTSRNIKPRGCMCSRVAERLNCDLKTGCCCKQTKIDEITSCDIRNEEDFLLLNYRTADYVDVMTQNSSKHTNGINLPIRSRDNYSIQNETDKISVREKIVSAKGSKAVAKKRVIKTFTPNKNHIKECEMKKLNRTTLLGISDDDKIVLLSEETAKTRKKDKDTTKNRTNLTNDANILQSYETKKAVLEIYAEKTVSEHGAHFVAKLPKFVYEKESEITRNYEKIATNSYKSVCRRKVFRMSVN